MKISFTTKQEAQDRADKMHVDLKMTNKLYKASCDLYDAHGGKKGGTARWAIPFQDLEQDEKSPNFGKPVDTLWHVTVDSRVRPVLSKAEVDKISEWKAVKEGI